MRRAEAFEFDGRERACPVAAAGAVVEHRLPRPCGGRMRVGAHGVLQRSFVVAAPPRLEMQATEAQPVRLMMLEHRVISGECARPIARQLRGLGAEQPGHRFVRDEAVRLGGVLCRGARIAGADGDHAVRQRHETLFAPARPRSQRHERRDVEDETQDAPDDRQRDRRCRDDPERQHQRDFVFDPAPHDRDEARIVREPHQAPGGQRQRG